MIRNYLTKRRVYVGMLLIIAGVAMPSMFEFLWSNMVVAIRTAIVSGDSGHLVLTASILSIINMVQGVLLIMGVKMVCFGMAKAGKNRWVIVMSQILVFTGMNLFIQEFYFLDVELISNELAAVTTFFFFYYIVEEKNHIGRDVAIAVQVFFAFEWLNVIPALTVYNFGITDIAGSIKLSSDYLGSTSVLNFIGFAFFIALIFSSIITVSLFATYDRNIAIARENYEKQLALDSIRSKIIQNRVYEEVNTITHDLKTPLVTIQGLNSLLSMTRTQDKIGDYTERIDNAVTKMTDMISGFLYESSYQKITTEEIIDYIRAQIPVEDESLTICFEFGDDLPSLYINKIRVSRAIINIIENAMIVETKKPGKKITIRVYEKEDYVVIEIEDNGIGIPAAQMEKIWEIGYSTKETTGLGLAFVKKVIEDNGGEVSIQSIVDEGTLVRVQLPNESLVNQED